VLTLLAALVLSAGGAQTPGQAIESFIHGHPASNACAQLTPHLREQLAHRSGSTCEHYVETHRLPNRYLYVHRQEQADKANMLIEFRVSPTFHYRHSFLLERVHGIWLITWGA
jgi:hypothetical protein